MVTGSAGQTTLRYTKSCASRIILQIRFPRSAVASSGESVDIWDALEIVQSLSLPFCSARFFLTHLQSLMFSYSCTFYIPHVFSSSHDRCISHQPHILFLKFLHVDFFSIFLFLYLFPRSCIISFSSLMRLNFDIVICLI